VVPGVAHHIVQRGNNRQDVFFVENDFLYYLRILEQQSKRNDFEILGYCLMTNHIHLIGIPAREDSLRNTVGRTHWIYAQYINRAHGRSGHLWQNRFYSCPLDERHLPAAMAYIERNPLRAKIVRHPWNYKWSSAGAHSGDKAATRFLNMAYWNKLLGDLNWKSFLERDEDKNKYLQIRLHTSRGRPWGDERFLAKLETTVGRRLRPLAVGRPKRPK